jgi:hypothetical protein
VPTDAGAGRRHDCDTARVPADLVQSRAGHATVHHRSAVDGVPVYWAETAGPLRATLSFRTGTADEPFAKAGWTHAIEHLALFGLGTSPHDGNGSVDLFTTRFTAAGTPDHVVGFLGDVCTALHDQPVDRWEAEQRILLLEADRRGWSDEGLLLRYACSGVAVWDDGLMLLVGLDGHSLRLNPSIYPDSQRLRAPVESCVAPGSVVAQGERVGAHARDQAESVRLQARVDQLRLEKRAHGREILRTVPLAFAAIAVILLLVAGLIALAYRLFGPPGLTGLTLFLVTLSIGIWRARRKEDRDQASTQDKRAS